MVLITRLLQRVVFVSILMLIDSFDTFQYRHTMQQLQILTVLNLEHLFILMSM
jgi:hypothetical protein